MAAYALGDAVRASYDGADRVGEVVGMFDAHGTVLYDVSFEEVVAKALPEGDLGPVAARELRSALTVLVGNAQGITSTRRALLRTRFVEFLTHALERLELAHDAGEYAFAEEASFPIGKPVGVSRGDCWLLGTVRGMARGTLGPRYDVEALGDLVRVEPTELMELNGMHVGAPFALGERARMVAAGHEADASFAGTVCGMWKEGAAWRFALMFDDGDVMEELGPSDLVHLGERSKGRTPHRLAP